MQIYICRIDRKLRTTVASGRRIGQMGVKDAKIFPCKSFCITWILNHVDILPPLKKRWSSLSFWLVKKQIILSSLYVLGVYHVPVTVPGISLITKKSFWGGNLWIGPDCVRQREYVQHLQGGKGGRTNHLGWVATVCVFTGTCVHKCTSL